MTRRGKMVFARFLGVLAAVALFSAPLAAQQTTGKLEGTVTDQAGVPIANAQILLVGTSLGTVTNDKGYYFINNVPVGSYAVRAQFIGYAPAELRGVRVLGGQTVTADVKMEASAVQVTAVTVTGYTNAIVPRDQVTSKSIVGGDLVNNLPVDDVRAIISVQPGVVESGSQMGLSIRGGRPGEANIYIDGAPVRAQQGSANGGSTPNPAISLGTNAVEEASVTTGALGVEFADAQSGVISFTSRAGGQSLAGSLGYETDEPFGNSISLGMNRFEGSVGGPVPSVKNLTFFLSGVVQGQLADARGWGAENLTRFVTGGLDTTVTVTSGGTTQSFAIPQFVQYSGSCPSGADGSNAARDAILNNYGVECQGRRFPFNWSSDMKFQGKLQYTYGDGSRVFFSGSANGRQGRNAPGANILAPSLFTGYHNWSRFGALDVNHVFQKSAERALSLNVNLSYQQDNQIVGPLDPAYESSTRNPTLGLEWGTIDFAGIGAMPFPIGEDIINNIRTNSGLRVPLLNRDDLRNTQESRINPYGMETSWIQGGFDQGATLYRERRMTARATADWQMNRFNRFQFGGDVVKTNLAFWSSGMLRQSFMDAYVVDPLKYGIYGADRLDLGDVVIELGVRYDFYNSNALFATTPGRIYSNPAWSPQAASNADSLAASIGRVFTPSTGHSSISPRLRVAFPVTEHTSFRMSYAHQVQSPDFNTLLTGINNDLDFTNTNDIFGRDLQFGKTIQFEFGLRHAFSQDMVLDISAYNKDKVSDFAARILPYPDPLNLGDTINLNVMTNADFGNVRGVDFKLDRRIGNYVNASVGYTFQLARGTGSDPLSYINTFSRQISQVTQERVPPPQAILPTDDNRAHNVVGSVGLNLPDDWRKGTAAGNIFRNISVFATFRVQSGLPYTRLKADGGTGLRAPRTAFGLVGSAEETLNSSTLPWIKNVNLRVNKGFKIGGTDIAAFADFRNLLNFKNVTQLFAETGDVVNAKHREISLSSEFVNLRTEAANNSRLLANNDINLVPSCASWTITGGDNGAVVNCIMLRRAEARFGDGNGLYTVAEQEAAFNAFYDAFNGPSTFYGEPRHIRIGFELNLR